MVSVSAIWWTKETGNTGHGFRRHDQRFAEDRGPDTAMIKPEKLLEKHHKQVFNPANSHFFKNRVVSGKHIIGATNAGRIVPNAVRDKSLARALEKAEIADDALRCFPLC